MDERAHFECRQGVHAAGRGRRWAASIIAVTGKPGAGITLRLLASTSPALAAHVTSSAATDALANRRLNVNAGRDRTTMPAWSGNAQQTIGMSIQSGIEQSAAMAQVCSVACWNSADNSSSRTTSPQAVRGRDVACDHFVSRSLLTPLALLKISQPCTSFRKASGQRTEVMNESKVCTVSGNHSDEKCSLGTGAALSTSIHWAVRFWCPRPTPRADARDVAL